MSDQPTNTALTIILRKYLDAGIAIDRLQEKMVTSTTGQTFTSPAMANVAIGKHLDAIKPHVDERDYNLRALRAWHEDPSTDLMLWKLKNPKP